MNIKRHMMGVGLACGIAAAIGTAQAGTFQGTIEIKTQFKKHEGFIQYSFKGDRLRMEIGKADKKSSSYSVMDMKTKQLYSVMPEQKMYMQLSAEGVNKGTGEDAQVTKTGRKETIAGYVCEEWLIKSKERQSQVWAAPGVADYPSFREDKNAQSAAWEREMAGKGYFPFRVVNLEPNGQEESRLEVVKVEKKSLPDDMFQVPQDYRKFEMPSFK